MAVDQVAILLRVVEALERLRIPYVIGGSYASAAHGFSRMTRDADLLAEIQPEHVPQIVKEFEAEFYVDEQAIKRAILTRRHFNLIHFDSSFMIDVFIAKPGGFDEKQLERRRLEAVGADRSRKAFVATPEDTILAKLFWFRQGNEVSDQQWLDILGVIKVQAGNLDLEYLRQWAQELKVADLLERAFAQSKDFL